MDTRQPFDTRNPGTAGLPGPGIALWGSAQNLTTRSIGDMDQPDVSGGVAVGRAILLLGRGHVACGNNVKNAGLIFGRVTLYPSNPVTN